MHGVIEAAILAAIHERLDRTLARPAMRYRPFIIDGVALGRVDDARSERLARFGPDVFAVDRDAIHLVPRLRGCESRSAALADVAQRLRDEGALPAWRDELYAVAVDFGAPPALRLERGAARYFGVRTWAAHINGIVDDGAATRLWFARRSRDKAVDPGLFDNLVGGGIAAGMRIDDTAIKEAWEEAGIDAALARNARPAGAVHVLRPMFDGLQRETVFVHDLRLPADFKPVNQDGEAIEHRLVDLPAAAHMIARSGGPDETTADASVVVLDYLIRSGAIAPDQRGFAALEALRYRGAD